MIPGAHFMKIGLTTLHNYNYGSILQCFATQEYLKKKECDCNVIEVLGSSGILRKIRSVFRLILLMLRYPRNAKDIYKVLSAQSVKALTISKESVNSMSLFLSKHLNIKKIPKSELSKVDFTSNFDLFFSGSDQVWNGSQVTNFNLYFLSFCPKEKRIAWSPSFGGKEISDYNKKRYKKFISEFAKVSCREESAVKIIKELCDVDAVQLFDPVVLLSAEEWRTFYTKENINEKARDYIFVLFLNAPKNEIVEKINAIADRNKYEIISFSYHYKVYERIENLTRVNGSPQDFLRLIDNAKMVLTDSFHVSLFSAILHTNFYTFDRNYTGGQNQSARLVSFFNLINDLSRYNPKKFDEQPNFGYIDTVFEKERNKFAEYFDSVKKYVRTLSKGKFVLFDEKKNCSGCGACVDACPVHAIAMENDEDGIYPRIDSSKCIKCKRCQSVCGQKDSTLADKNVAQAFVGISTSHDAAPESASGGIFYEIAKKVINENGFVYGAALVHDGNRFLCRHIGVDNLIDLSMLKNSKYVQSSSAGIFSDVKKQLDAGKCVLFSGTSCQVASLYSFLGPKQYENLLTIDLICHGVPSQKIFDDYISYLGSLHHGKITHFSFRSKDSSFGMSVPYVMSFTVENESGMSTVRHVKLRDSAYYRMFMACGGYRESCYHCKYAGLHKPADITLGDYYIKDSSKEIHSLGLDEKLFYSCVIVRSENGRKWIRNESILLHEIPISVAMKDHSALQQPSKKTTAGEKLYAMYKKSGFRKVQKKIQKKNKIVDIVKFLTKA